MDYLKVTIRDDSRKSGKRTFWAVKKEQNNMMTLFLPVDNEGNDYSTLTERNLVLLKMEMVHVSMIISEQPGVMDKTYGTLRLRRKDD